MGPVRLAHARVVQARGSRLRPCSRRGPSRGPARWCDALLWPASPVGTQEAAFGPFGTRSWGHGGDTVEPGSWREGPVVLAAASETSAGRAGHGRALGRFPKAERRASRSFGFAASARGGGSSAANADVHGAAPPPGRAAGRTRSERRWSKGFGPEIVGVSIEQARSRGPVDGVAHGATVAAAGLPGRPFVCRMGIRVRSAVNANAGFPERSAGRGGLRSDVAGSAATDAPPVDSPVTRWRWQHREGTHLVRGLRFPRVRVDSSVEGCGWCRAERQGHRCRGGSPPTRRRSRCTVLTSCRGSHRGWRHPRRSWRLPRPIVSTEPLAGIGSAYL